MPYSPKHQYIFTHIMKTAGASLAKSLKENEGDQGLLLTGRPNREINHICRFPPETSMEHLTPLQIRKVIGWQAFQSAFRFTIVRNPWDRVVSTYFWLRQGDHQADPRMKEFCEKHSFEEFACANTFLWPPPQHPHVFNPQGQCFHHKVCRFENLEEDLKEVFKVIGQEYRPLPHRHKTDHKPYVEYYSPKSIEAVRKKYEQDIKGLGYSFEPN